MKPSHSQILQQAEEAAQQRNWPLANQYLQRLLLTEEHSLMQSPPVEPDTEALLSIALQVLEWGDFQNRWEVAKVFPSFGTPAIAPLIALLQDEDADAEAQWFAVRILGGFNGPEVVTALMDVLKTSQNDELNGMAVTALGNLGDEAIEVLGTLLQQDTARLWATQALAQIRRPAAVPLLLSVVSDLDAQIRFTAIEALGSFHTPEISATLVQALQDPVASVRRAAVTALGFCEADSLDFDLIAQLRPLLLDINLDVCRQTAIALGRLGTVASSKNYQASEAAKTLFAVLQSRHTPEPLAMEIVRALSWIECPEALQYLHQSLIQFPLPESVRQEILVVLGHVDQPELKAQAAQILLELLDKKSFFSQSAPVKQLIALSLGQLGDLDALNPLINLLADPDMSVRLHVISALKALSPEAAYQRLQQLSQSESSSSELSQGVALALKEWQL